LPTTGERRSLGRLANPGNRLGDRDHRIATVGATVIAIDAAFH